MTIPNVQNIARALQNHLPFSLQHNQSAFENGSVKQVYNDQMLANSERFTLQDAMAIFDAAHNADN